MTKREIIMNLNKFYFILLLIFISTSCSNSTNNLSYQLHGLWKEKLIPDNKLTREKENLRQFLSKASYHYYNNNTLVFIVEPNVNEDTLLALLDKEQEIPIMENGTIFYYHYNAYEKNGVFIVETKLKENWYSDWLYSSNKQIYTLSSEKVCFSFMEKSLFCRIK